MKAKLVLQWLNTALITILLTAPVSCKKDEDSSSPAPPPNGNNETTPYVIELPSYFPNFVVPQDNPTTVEGVELGRKIYYDQMLSLGGPLEGKACASCHQQATNFSNHDPGRSVMPHTNLHWTSNWLWDGAKQGTLEDVMLFEVEDFFMADVSLFKADTTYRRMSYEAFGTEEITSELMAKAMAQFVRTLVSTNSKFDRFYRFEEDLTPLEKRGMMLFNTEEGDCFHCHSTPLTTDLLFHNNGVDSVFDDANKGRYLVTGDPADLGKFKTPNLRNVEMTAPYMHDGRFQTLEEVVEFYNSGVRHSPSLDPIMTKPGKEYGLGLTEYDKAALVAFIQ